MNGWGGYRPPTWQHPIGWNTLHETPPVITAPVVRERPSDFLFNGILRPAWAYRLELALIGLLWAINRWLTAQLGAYDAAQVILAAAIVVGLLNWTRDPLAAALFRSHLRRRWALACRHANLATRNDRVPRITRCTLTRAGEQLRVRVPAGGQVPDLEAEAERLAAFLAVREVRVTREPDSARYARVVVLRRDPLADPVPVPWPLAGAGGLSLWQPIPVGLDEDGSETPLSSQNTIWALRRRAFLPDPWPVLGDPALDRRLVAFQRASGGALQAPAHLPQHPPDVAGMVAHAGQPLDHLRDALQGPPVGREAMRTSALAQCLVDHGALFGRQLWPAALAASTGQCGGAACPWWPGRRRRSMAAWRCRGDGPERLQLVGGLAVRRDCARTLRQRCDRTADGRTGHRDHGLRCIAIPRKIDPIPRDGALVPHRSERLPVDDLGH